MTTLVDPREVRNLAAALYVHAGKPDDEVDLAAIQQTAAGAVTGMHQLLDWLEANPTASEEAIQYEAYECGKRNLPVNQLKTFFSCFYLMLLAKPDGPRLGLMVRATGIELFVNRIRTRLKDPFGWLNTLTQTPI